MISYGFTVDVFNQEYAVKYLMFFTFSAKFVENYTYREK